MHARPNWLCNQSIQVTLTLWNPYSAGGKKALVTPKGHLRVCNCVDLVLKPQSSQYIFWKYVVVIVSAGTVVFLHSVWYVATTTAVHFNRHMHALK